MKTSLDQSMNMKLGWQASIQSSDKSSIQGIELRMNPREKVVIGSQPSACSLQFSVLKFAVYLQNLPGLRKESSPASSLCTCGKL